MSTLERTQALPTGIWNADPVHSDIGFSIDYMSGTFSGTFSSFDVRVADGTLGGSADVSSIQVKDPNLEAHLQSPEFFDAERHPRLTFESHEVQRDGNAITIDGEITIKGRTQPIELRGTISDPITDPWGKERFGLKLAAELDRTTFGIEWNNPLPSGEPALANRVELGADIQFVQAS